MGLAEKNAYILQRYLGQGRKPTKAEYEKSKEHRIPEHWEAGQSQNWWVLGVGVRMAYGDLSETAAVRERLLLEKNVIGTWGSEQHSPNYWAFHMLGRLSMIKNLKDNDVIEMLYKQLEDFFKYCELALSPDGKKVFFCGMRGTCEPEYSSYEMWWLYTVYIRGQQASKKKYWKDEADKYGWLTDPWVASTLRGCIPTLPVDGIRSPTHFIEFGSKNKLVYTEDDQHPSTVFRGASGFLNGKWITAPVNYATRYRGKGSGSFMSFFSDPDVSKWTLEYRGPYNEITGRQPIVFQGPLPKVTKHLLWNSSGLHDFLASPGSPALEKPPADQLVDFFTSHQQEEQPSKTLWQRITDAVKNFFNRQ